MFRATVEFPISPDKLIIDQMKITLAVSYSNGLMVQPKRPDTMTRRVVTLRNDGGPQIRQSSDAYGVNIWADSLVDAQKMAVEIQRDLHAMPAPFTRMDRFTKAVEIDDDPQMTAVVSAVTKNLAHVYFTFRAQYRGFKP